MKRKIMILGVGLVLALTGCGSSTKVIEGQVSVIEDGSEEAEQETAPEAEQETDTEENETHKGYVFTYNDVVIEMDEEADPVIEKLGEANTYFEAPSCAFEGIDKMYGYNSFEVDTYPLEGKDYISSVIFKDDTITTSEGVGIGDTADKVEEIYGEEGISENGMLVFAKDGMKLCFIMQDEAVISVEYRSTVLDE